MGNGQTRKIVDQLSVAIGQGDVAQVQTFLHKQAAAADGTLTDEREARTIASVDLNALEWNGATALQFAAMCGQAEIVRLILDTPRPGLPKVDIDARDKLQRTALHMACARRAPPCCAQVVADLLHRKANPCIADSAGLTALDVARRSRCQLCVRTLEDNAKLWQGWVDYDEKGLLGIPNWVPRWLVVLRDRHPNTGISTWVSGPTVQCWGCQSILTAQPYVVNVTCQRCGSDNGVTPTVQLALYAAPGQQAGQSVLPDAAVPVVVLPVPANHAQRTVSKLDDASWKGAAGALLQGRFRRALQSAPNTDRAYGLTLKLLGGPGSLHCEFTVRVATEADRTRLMEVLEDPSRASYLSWCEHVAPTSATAAAAAAGAPQPVHLAVPDAVWASQALAADGESSLGGPPAAPPPAPEKGDRSSDGAGWKSGAAEMQATSGAAASAPSHPAAASSAPAADQDPTGVSGESELCVVCLERPADTAVVPCGHLCGCERCLRAMNADSAGPTNCPMCRGPMSSIIRIYRG